MTRRDPCNRMHGLGKGAGFRRLAAIAIVGLFLITSLLPLISLESSSSDAQYDGTYYNVTYHPYYGSSGPTVNGACNDGGDYSAITVTYYGDVVSTEWNPQLWAGTVSNSDTTVVNWYGFKDYNITEKEGNEAYKTVFQVGITVVFTGWALASEFDADGKPKQEVNRLPGDIIESSKLPESGGTIHLYATWGVLNDVKTALASAKFSTGNVFTNYMLISANGAASLSSTTGVGFTFLGHDLYENTYLYIHGKDVLQCDVIVASTIIRNKESSYSNEQNHGDDGNGIFANGHTLVIGADVETEGFGSLRTYPQIYGGGTSDKVSNTNVIIHSGTYYNVLAGSLSGSITWDTKVVVKDVTVLDSLIGGSAKTGTTIGGSTYVYATSLHMPGDYWEESNLYGDGFSEVDGLQNTESTILTGGSSGDGTGSNGQISRDTHVYLSGDSDVWDVQGAGRRGSTNVLGTANVTVSGTALVKHALCGSITDGVNNNVGHRCVKNVILTVKDSTTVAGVFGAGYDTFYKANYASMYGSDSSIDIIIGGYKSGNSIVKMGSPVIGYVYGGGYRGTIGAVPNGTSSQATSNPLDHISISIVGGTILYDVFAGGRGGLDKICHNVNGDDVWGRSDTDTTGYSLVYANSISISVGSSVTVKGSVYGGGESVPVISSYDGVTGIYSGNIGSANSFSTGFGVASVICSNVSISISGTVEGSVYGAGKGVDTTEVDSYGRHPTAYIFAIERGMDRLKEIPWIGGSSAGTTVVSTVNYNSYASSVCTNISVTSSGNIKGSVYGGGALGQVTATSIDVGITGGTVEGSVYGAGMGKSGSTTMGLVTSGNIGVTVSGGTISGDVYGGGAYSQTITSGTIEVIVSGGTVGRNVFGGGLGVQESTSTKSKRKVTVSGGSISGSVYGSSSLGNDGTNTGTGSFACDVVITGGSIAGSVYGGGFKGIAYGDVTISVSGTVNIGHSVYGGADIGQVTLENPQFDKVLLYGSTTITVDGSDGVTIGLSIFGSGNSCLVSGSKTITISKLSGKGMESLQNINDLTIIDSDISLSGRADASSAQASVVYSLNHIETLVLKGTTILEIDASVGDIHSYSSQTAGGVVTTESSPGNTLRINNGSFLTLEYTNDEGRKVYGQVNGYTVLSMPVSEDYHGAFVYGAMDSPGGFVVVENGKYRAADYSDFSASGCRCWFIGGAVSYSTTMVIDNSSGSETIQVSLPVMSGDSYILYTGFDYTVKGMGGFGLLGPDGSVTERSDYILSILKKEGTAAGFTNDIILYDGTRTVSGTDYSDYVFKANGIPSISLKLDHSIQLLYTEYVSDVTIHLWEAVQTSEGYIVKNRIDVDLQVHSEVMSFPTMGEYTIDIDVDENNSGTTYFTIPRSFYGYTLSGLFVSLYHNGTDTKLDGTPFEDLTVGTVRNNEGTLGWSLPMNGSIPLSSFPVYNGDDNNKGVVLGETAGSFSATLAFTVGWNGEMPSDIEDYYAVLKMYMSNETNETRQFSFIIKIDTVSYNVTFHNRTYDLQSEDIKSISVIKGSVIRSSDYPLTWDHFVGWFTDSACRNSFNSNTAITSDIDLYAGYMYTAVFDNMDGTKSTAYVQIGDGGSGTLYKPQNPERTGYSFDGWFDQALDKEYTFTDGKLSISNDITLYAKWTGNPLDVIITATLGTQTLFDVNGTVRIGDTYGDLTFTYGGTECKGISNATVLVQDILDEKESEYKFVRWFVSIQSGVGVGIYDDTSVVEDHVTVVKDSYGNVVSRTVTISAEFAVTALHVTLVESEPYDFGEGKAYNYEGAEVYIQAPKDFLIFEKDGCYTLSPGNASFMGYKLLKWYYNGKDQSIVAGESLKITLENGKFYANLDDKNKVEITLTDGAMVLTPDWGHLEYEFHIQDPVAGSITATRNGSIIESGATLHHGDTVKLEYTPSGGYTFESWGCGSGGTFDSTSANPSTLTVSGDCSVYVRVGGLYSYTLNVNVDGVPKSGLSVMIQSTSGSGSYVFSDQGDGRYISTVKFGNYDIIVSDSSWRGKVDSIAVYSEGSATVDLWSVTAEGMDDKVSFPHYAVEGSDVALTLPTGYKVDSMTATLTFGEGNAEVRDLGGGSGPFSTTMDDCPLRFTATGYGPMEYIVTLKYGNGTADSTITVYYGGTYSGLTTPTYPEYTFSGWWYENSIQVNNEDQIVVNSNHTLVAKWMKNDDALYIIRVYQQDLNGGYGEYSDYTYSDTYGKTVSFSDHPIQIPGFKYVSHEGEITSVVIEKDKISRMEVYYDRISYSFSLILHYPDSSTDTQSMDAVYGAPIPYPTVAEHYQATGFYSDPSMTTTISTIPAWDDADVKEIHVKVEQIKYTITYNLNGGSFTDASSVPRSFTYSESALSIPDPVRTGYVFQGWELDGVNIGHAVPAKTEGDIQLLALWTDVFTITVSTSSGTVTVSGDVTSQGDGKYTVTGVKTVMFESFLPVYRWIVDGSPVEPADDGTLTLEVSSDVTVYPYLLLIGDAVIPTEINAVVSFGFDLSGEYGPVEVETLDGLTFSIELDGYGFQDGSVECTDGVLSISGLTGCLGTMRVLVLFVDGATQYALDLTVLIVSNIHSCDPEVLI